MADVWRGAKGERRACEAREETCALLLTISLPFYDQPRRLPWHCFIVLRLLGQSKQPKQRIKIEHNIDLRIPSGCRQTSWLFTSVTRALNSGLPWTVSLRMMLTETLVHEFNSSKLDFCNALLYGSTKSVIDKLQYVQNCAARLVTRARSSEHITPVLPRLHWLPVRQRFTYKILLLTYKALNGMAPRCIADLLQPYTPTRQLRSSSKKLLVTPKLNLKFHWDRSFQVAAPRLWNSLTDDIRLIQNLDVFKSKIKTLLFIDAFIS